MITIAKQITTQRYVYKVNTSRLRRAKWNLNLTIDEAIENKELIKLSESQAMRFIDDIKGVTNPMKESLFIKKRISRLNKSVQDRNVTKEIKSLNKRLNELLFQPDYVCIVIDKIKDFDYINAKGFSINGLRYKRLVGTTGGVKNSTIVYVSERVYDELSKRLDNGRDMNKEMIPAKLEAYKALACSASTPVTMPKGIVVVDDCITYFKSDYIKIDDSIGDEPELRYFSADDPDAELIELNDSDGYGFGTPELMEQWGIDLELDYILPSAVIRNSFCKGTVMCVNFQRFAHEVAHTDEITDVWGQVHKIDDVQLILTVSMLKLWDSYKSIDDYLENCAKNGYEFAITKASVKVLDNEGTLNYQFLQSYELTEADIDELLEPTITTIKDILSDDYRKTVLYMKGENLNDKTVQYLDGDIGSALMIEPEMWNDPFVRATVRSMIKKRVNDAKLGVIQVHGNYSIISGDPYSLCQSMFGLEVTGLLKAGEIYSKYWLDEGVEEVVCFRAPMTCHNNIRKQRVAGTDEMKEFYKYMTTVTIFNSWDTSAHALNGADKD